MKLLRPHFGFLPLSVALSAAFAGPVHAQSLLELYESARAYDATWQSAKAQYDANLFRAEQAKAGILPSANLSAGVSRSNLDNTVPAIDRGITTQTGTVSASQPLYRPANFATYAAGQAPGRTGAGAAHRRQPGPDHPREPGLLRRAGGAGHADLRAARRKPR